MAKPLKMKNNVYYHLITIANLIHGQEKMLMFEMC